MSEWTKVTTVADLDLLDAEDMTRGYIAGLDRQPEPGSDKSRAFWHGWRNGIADRTGRVDAEQAMLAQQYVARHAKQCPAGSPQTDHGASIAACAQQDRYPLLYALIQSGGDVCAAIEAVLTERTR